MIEAVAILTGAAIGLRLHGVALLGAAVLLWLIESAAR